MIGSSPLARGLLRRTQYCHFCGRIIPACAGFTTAPQTSPTMSGDHPRLRGVYMQPYFRVTSATGSSPLARGLPVGSICHMCMFRIIPACAGFTVEQLEPSKVDAGSSPLARGLPVSLTWDATRQGIIPACAGFTPTPGSSTPHGPDHPRLRGVYLKTVDALVQTVGSSPLARGLLGARGIDRAGRRIIPACAGFTGARACSR